MNGRRYGIGLLVALGFCLGMWGRMPAQDSKAPTPEQDALAAKWQEFGKPGPEHAQLKYKEGRWKMRMEMWVAPDAEPTVSEGTSEMKLIMGGRYLLDTTRTTYNGQPFEGLGIVGYDNLKKQFVTVWIDNMGTGMSPGTGSYDAANKTYTYTTLAPDVMLGDYKPGRSVETIVNENEWTVEMYDTAPDGKEFLTLKGFYTRVR